MMNFDLEERLQQRLHQSLYRQRLVLDSPQQPELLVNGQRYLAFCSNDYLGLANHPEIRHSAQQAVNEYGLGGGASHLIVGHSRPHRQLEEELADFVGRPRALLFSTGYMANLGVMSALLEAGDCVFQDRLNHASLLDAGRLSGARFQRYQHMDLDNLEQRLRKSRAKRKLIATDAVFSMDGDRSPLAELATLAGQYQAALMVDDAHGFGCQGKQGRGSVDSFGLSQDQAPILMATLGKALGTAGAFVAGSEALIETLIQFSRSYIYTTAMPPAIAAATRTSLKIVREEEWRREKLRDLIACFRKACEQTDVPLIASSTAIQPVLSGSVEQTLRASEQLLKAGILATPIRPPTVPKGCSRLRITLSAAHQKYHIDQLVAALSNIIWHTTGQAA